MNSISGIMPFIRNCYLMALANVNRNKSKHRKPWIRFERKHSLSMVHLDWRTRIRDGRKVYVCVVL